VTKAGILGSLRFGSGILLARLDDDNNPDGPPTWSHPSAISTAGLGFGGQAGFELADFVFILNDAESLAAFSRLGSLTLSGNFSIAFGPVGRNAEIAGGVSTGGGGKMMSFCKTKGLFGGVSVESGVVVERRGANRRFYGRKVTAAEILSGSVRAVEEADVEGLMKVLGEVFAPRGSGTDENGQGEGESQTGQVGQAVGEGSHESSSLPQAASAPPTPGPSLDLEPTPSGSRSREEVQIKPSEPQNKASEPSA
jgi:lipid-binding SYLF domain-containing protein